MAHPLPFPGTVRAPWFVRCDLGESIEVLDCSELVGGERERLEAREELVVAIDLLEVVVVEVELLHLAQPLHGGEHFERVVVEENGADVLELLLGPQLLQCVHLRPDAASGRETQGAAGLSLRRRHRVCVC